MAWRRKRSGPGGTGPPEKIVKIDEAIYDTSCYEYHSDPEDKPVGRCQQCKKLEDFIAKAFTNEFPALTLTKYNKELHNLHDDTVETRRRLDELNDTLVSKVVLKLADVVTEGVTSNRNAAFGSAFNENDLKDFGGSLAYFVAVCLKDGKQTIDDLLSQELDYGELLSHFANHLALNHDLKGVKTNVNSKKRLMETISKYCSDVTIGLIFLDRVPMTAVIQRKVKSRRSLELKGFKPPSFTDNDNELDTC